MAYEQRDLSGSLFKNDKREKDSHPNLTGTVMIGGVEYWASGWTKERANGDKWISLSFKVKEQRNGSQGAPMQRGRFDDDLDDSVPFASCDPDLEWRVG
jgi:hypothetical protein